METGPQTIAPPKNPARPHYLAPVRVACLTMARDDGAFVDIWVRYYAALFGAVNCYIVDHGSTQTAALDRARADGVQVLRMAFDYPSFAPDGIRPDGQPVQFDGYRFNFLGKLRTALRVFYDVVVFHDVDEVLVVHPDRKHDLAAYIAEPGRWQTHAVLGGIGVEVFHDPLHEAPYDPAIGVLDQRRNAHFRLPECKPALFASNTGSTPHGTLGQPFAIDPDLWLLHLKFLDRDLLYARQQHRVAVVQKGEVPDWTRWGWALSEVDARLQGFADRPLDPDDTRARRFLAAHFTAAADGGFVVDRAKDASPGQYEADAGLPIAVQDTLHNARFHLPTRFQGMNP